MLPLLTINFQCLIPAAAQPPPPYALVVSSCHLNHRETDLQQQFQPFPQPPHTGNNVCCVIGTLCQHRQSPNLSASQSTHDTLTLTNSGPINTFYYSSYPQSSNEIHVSSECINCNKQCSSSPEVHERLPTYEEAIRIEDEMTGEGEAKY